MANYICTPFLRISLNSMWLTWSLPIGSPNGSWRLTFLSNRSENGLKFSIHECQIFPGGANSILLVILRIPVIWRCIWPLKDVDFRIWDPLMDEISDFRPKFCIRSRNMTLVILFKTWKIRSPSNPSIRFEKRSMGDLQYTGCDCS